jgi:excisionase family DNA binding protein
MRTLSTPRLLDVRQAADLLGYSRHWIYRHLEELPAFRVGGQLRFDPDDLERYIEAQKGNS